jgi:hypothetical protein
MTKDQATRLGRRTGEFLRFCAFLGGLSYFVISTVDAIRALISFL